MTAPSLRVLVVEDNPEFLSTLCDMVAGLGHHAHGVASAEQALPLLAAGGFQVLLADITLPGMSGVELASIAVRAAPGLRIVFSSGFGYLLSDKLDFPFTLLHKPYFLNQLKQALAVPSAG